MLQAAAVGVVLEGPSTSGTEPILHPCCLHLLGFRGGRMNEASRYFSASSGKASPLEAACVGAACVCAGARCLRVRVGGDGGFGRGFATSGNSRWGLVCPCWPRCTVCRVLHCVMVLLPAPGFWDASDAHRSCNPVTSPGVPPVWEGSVAAGGGVCYGEMPLAAKKNPETRLPSLFS